MLALKPSEICEYMLANRNIGTKAIEIRKRTRLSAANALLAKILTCISGGSVESSVLMKRPIRIRPTMIEPIVAGLSQPQLLACWSPSTRSPSPPADRTAPR